MDEQRAWIKSRRKKRLRLLAAALSFCILLTTYPDILATISALAEGGQGNENTVYVSGFSILADEVRVQTVPAGTSLSELTLPDTLMAVMTVQNSENSSEEGIKDDPEKEIDPDDSDQDQEAGDENGDTEEAGDENSDSGEAGDENEAGGETGDENGSSGETGDGSDVETGDKSDSSVDESTEVTEEEQGSNEAGTGVLEVQTGEFDMPEYQSENVITVETLENIQASGTQEKIVSIEGVTWQSEPTYDGDVEGTYLFTAVLPEGYVLMDGISLPEIIVTVQENEETAIIQALLDRIAALPDVDEYLAGEPDIEEEEACKEWMEKLYVYAEEAFGIWEEYEKLTQEQQAQVPKDLLVKLAAWVELAEKITGNSTMMLAANASHICNGITFTAWTDTANRPTSGNYYLENNVTLTNPVEIEGTLNLCLNGKTISGNVPNGMLRVYGGTLNLYDCSGNGAVYCPEGNNPIQISQGGTLNLYDGTVQSAEKTAIPIGKSGSDNSGGCVVNVYGGKIIGGTNGILVNASLENPSVHIYGGEITGGTAINIQSGNVTLSGGTITGTTYAVQATNGATVTVSGDATLNTSISTVNNIIASGAGQSGLGNTYIIKYNSNVTEGSTVIVKGSTDKAHYQLDSSEYVLAAKGADLVAGKKYTVTLNADGGVIENADNYNSYISGEGLTLPTPTKTGYTFGGWYDNADYTGTKVTIIPSTANGNKTYNAKWTASTYSVTYNKDNGTITDENKYTSYTYGKGLTLPTPTKTGYTFGGWYDNAGYTGTKETVISSTATGNKTYYAKWTASTYSVTYNKDNGTITNENKYTSYTYGKGLTLPTPTKTGYTFGGWYDNAGYTGTKVTIIPSTATGNKTYYAKWIAGQYKVTFDYQGATGGSDTAEQTVTFDSAYGTLPTPKKKGYTFEGWYTEASGQGRQVTAQTTVIIAEDHKLFAYWKEEIKTVLNDNQLSLAISDFSYGAQKLPNPQGSIKVTDTNGDYTYLYSMDNSDTWITVDSLPKSGSGYLVPGEYRVKMTYTGDSYTGVKTASFTVTKKSLEVQKGTLEAENKNYDGNTNADLKEGGQLILTGVVAGDDVTIGGSLSARFTGVGPKKNLPVSVTGFLLEGVDARYYTLKNSTLTLYATINNADGTPPSGGSSSGNGNSDSGNGNSNSENNGDTDNDNNGDNRESSMNDNNDNESGNNDSNGDNGTSENNSNPGTPAVMPPSVAASVETLQTAPETDTGSNQRRETQPVPEQLRQDAELKDIDTLEQNSTDSAQSEIGIGQQSEIGTVQTISAFVNDGRIAISGGTVETGNLGEDLETTTVFVVGEGAVIVTIVCEEENYAAGVKDTVGVTNAVLTPEQIQLVNDGETIEVRLDVKDISETITRQDKEVIERGLAEYRKEIPELTIGMYVDISMFIKIGAGDWDAVNSTEEMIEVVLGVPEELKEDGREFYIIRSHEGEYAILTDMDNDLNTITIGTNMFSAYAIAYKQADAQAIDAGNNKCRLCHICPTFLGICYFIWLTITVAVIIIVIVLLHRRKQVEEVGHEQ